MTNSIATINSLSTLSQWQVVVMRPLHQSSELMAALERLGVTPVLIPMLEIRPVLLSPSAIQQSIAEMTAAHYVVITSANVIQYCPPAIINALKELLIITMGAGTSASLKPYGISVLITPLPGATSESLLEEPIFAPGSIRDKSIVILTGKGGRTVLGESLQARGARVNQVICYESLPTRVDLRQPVQAWQQQKNPVFFLVTSLKILLHLTAITPPEALAWLLSMPLIVVSDRIRDAALQLGFKRILVSRSADVDGLTAAVQQVINSSQ